MEKKSDASVVLRIFASLVIWFVSRKITDFYLTPILQERLPEVIVMLLRSTVITYSVPLILLYLVIKGMKKGDNTAAEMNLSPARFIKVLIIQSGLSMIAMVPVNVVVKILGISTPATTPEEIIAHPFFYIFLLIFFAPVIEEFVWRKLFLDRLLVLGTVPAIIWSSVFFALPHFFSQGPAQVPYTFVLGLVLSYVIIRTRKLWPAIILHSLSNIYGGFIPTLWPKDNPIMVMAFAALYIIIVPACAITLTALNSKEIRRGLKKA